MDYLRLTMDKETDLSTWRNRMDADAAVFHNKTYTLTGVNGKKISAAYHITLPEAEQFLDKAVSKLIAVNSQIHVESDTLPEDGTHTVETFLTDLQYEVDALLTNKGQLDSRTQHSELCCARGPIVEQNLLRVEDGVFIADSRPLDSRWFTWEITDGRMEWGCIETKRKKADIERTYNVSVSGSTGQIKDFWDDKINVIYLDGRQIDERPNLYGEPPFVIAFPSTSTSIQDDNYIKYQADSIMHGLRQGDGYLFDERNYLASMYKTQASLDLFPALNFPSNTAERQEKPEEYPNSPGKMLDSIKTPETIPHGTVSEATDKYDKLISDVMQRVTFGALDYGIIDLPLSYLAINRVSQGRDDLLLPRLNCYAMLRQASDKQRIRQILKLAQTIEIGEEGHKRTYKYTDLDGKYTIKYRFFTMTQEGMAAASSLATQLKPHVSEEYIQDNILKLEDPSGERVKIAAQSAAEADPVISLFNQAVGFIKAQEQSEDKETKQVNDMQAKLIESRIISILKQRKASENEPQNINLEQSTQKKETGVPGMPMFSNTGAATQ